MRLNLAERILNQDVLSKDEALALFEDETIDTFELLNEAYIIRKHFSGKSETQYDIKCEKWNLFEDCGYCGQSVKMKKTTLCVS